MEKYQVFLGSDIAKTYSDAKKFTLDRVDEYVEFDNKKLKIVLSHIEEFNGNVFSLIFWMKDYHVALASKHLLENDISGFKENLNESKEISFEEFQAIFNSEKMKGQQKNLEDEMKKRYGYKNKKSIYKDMSFLSLEQDASFIIIAPLHQDSLGGYSGISLPDNSALEFKYDKSISDEELGKAIRQALTYCTSIYR